MTVDRLLLALYPQAWRARYGAELADLLADLRADGSPSWRVRADLVRAAGSEHLRAAELRGDAPARSRARGGSLAVLWAWALFVVAGCAVAKFAEHWSDGYSGDHRVPAAAFGILVGAALCAAALVAVGLALAVPALLSALRSGLWPHVRRRVSAATGLSAVLAAATVGLAGWASHLTPRQRDGHDLEFALGFLLWAGLCAVVVAAWTSVATSAARRIDLPARVLRAQAVLGAAVTVAMAVMTAATLIWSIAVSRVPVGPLAAMSVAVALAAAGSTRAGRAMGGLEG